MCKKRALVRQKLLKQHRFCCYCKKKLIDDGTIEHKIPKSVGGTDSIDNITVSCAECNHMRGSLHGAMMQLSMLEKEIQQHNFRQTLLGRIINVFFPHKEKSKFERLAKKIQGHVVTILSKIDGNYYSIRDIK